MSRDCNSFTCAPILIIGFNRPEFVRDQIEAISAAKPSQIFIAIDGPRPDHPGEDIKCKETAEQIKRITWPCEISTRIRNENLGCKYGPPDAISWFFSQVTAGIILEDDCRPTIDFLRFASELLIRYKDDERVGMISGNNHYGFMSNPQDSYRFSMNISIWGWASWSRAWKYHDVEPEHFRSNANQIFDTTSLTRRGKRLASAFFNQVLSANSTWDTQWALTLLKKEMFSITPARNLVANMGFQPESTHTGGYNFDTVHFINTQKLHFPLIHPQHITRDIQSDRRHELRSFAFLPRALTALGLRFPACSRPITHLAHTIEKRLPALFRL